MLPHALAGAFAMARFITEGHLLRHLRRMCELYPQHQQVLIEALAKTSQGQLVL